MGSLLLIGEGKFAANTLNDMFDADNIADTFAKIEELRKTFPNLLNPMPNPGPKDARRQTLRFAAFLITDQVVFGGTYPAPKFKKWLKWLTWLDSKAGGKQTLNDLDYGGSGSQLVLKILSEALPPGGPPSPVRFDWSNDATGNNFGVAAWDAGGKFAIKVTSVDHSKVSANSDDEDDV